MAYGIVRFVYFAVLALLNWVIFRQYREAAIKLTGVSKNELYEYAEKSNPNLNKGTAGYIRKLIVKYSKRPKRAKRMLTVYALGMIPTVICIVFAVIGLPSRSASAVFQYATVALPVLIIAVAVFSYFYVYSKKKCVAEEITDSPQELKELIKEVADTILPDRKGRLRKKLLIIFACVAVAVVTLAVVIVTRGPNKPITAQELHNTLVAQKFTPCNMKEEVLPQMPDSGLEDCIIIDQDDIRLEFYNFDKQDSAIRLFGKARKLIVENNKSPQKVLHQTNFNNSIYALETDTQYSVVIYIKNTVINAYSTPDKADELKKILTDIGYMEN